MLTLRFQRGMTLIELSVTIAIAAILLAIAVPSFQVMLANSQIRTGAQALHDGLQLARVEAIRRNERVIFTKNTQTGWTVTLQTGGAVVQTRPFSEGSSAATVTVTPSTATQVTFDGLGRVVTNADASSTFTQLDIGVPTTLIPATSARNRRITVTGGGAVRLCDPSATPGVGMGC